MNEFLQGLERSNGAPAFSLADILLHLLLSFLLGQLVAWVYTWTHRGMSYSRSNVQSLVLLCLIVTTVMLAIGNSMARAFGLFGALALIRFRTPIKDTRDTIFLFLSVGIGICVGTGNLALAVIGAAFALLVALYLAFSRFGEKIDTDGVLRFSMPAEAEQEGCLRRVLQHYCRSFALMQLGDGGSGGTMEFSYWLRLEDPAQSSALVQDISAIPGVRGANLLMQNEDQEV